MCVFFFWGGDLRENVTQRCFFLGMIMQRRMMVERESKEFIADHSFVFALMHDRNLVLFYGRVV